MSLKNEDDMPRIPTPREDRVTEARAVLGLVGPPHGHTVTRPQAPSAHQVQVGAIAKNAEGTHTPARQPGCAPIRGRVLAECPARTSPILPAPVGT